MCRKRNILKCGTFSPMVIYIYHSMIDGLKMAKNALKLNFGILVMHNYRHLLITTTYPTTNKNRFNAIDHFAHPGVFGTSFVITLASCSIRMLSFTTTIWRIVSLLILNRITSLSVKTWITLPPVESLKLNWRMIPLVSHGCKTNSIFFGSVMMVLESLVNVSTDLDSC